MKLTRRDFVKATAAGGVGIAALGWPRRAYAAFAQTQPLLKFMRPEAAAVRATSIPHATSRSPRAASPMSMAPDYYQIAMREFEDKLHPDPNLPTLRGCAVTATSARP